MKNKKRTEYEDLKEYYADDINQGIWRNTQMDFIQLKIEKDDSIVKYIKIIREFDSSLSVGAIKQRIDENDFVIGFDLEYYDVLEEINEMDQKKLFREMIQKLYQAGAQISIYQNEEPISLEYLDNWLETLDEINRQTENDIARELGQ